MRVLYPFLNDELGALVLWISLLAGFTSAMVNGVAESEAWERACRDGASGVWAKVFVSLLLIIRSMVLGLFLGTVVAGFLIGREQLSQPIIIGAAGLAAFIADPLLEALKRNWQKLVQRLFGGKFIEGNDVPQQNKSASAGDLDN